MNIYLSNLIYIACTIIDENYNLIMSHLLKFASGCFYSSWLTHTF